MTATTAAASRIQVVRGDGGTEHTTQTAGIARREVFARPGAWVGVARTAPGVVSGWHHHGEYDTYLFMQGGRVRMEFGSGGGESCEAAAGDFLHVPKGSVHRESNPGVEEQVLVVVRVGSGEPVFNVEGPADRSARSERARGRRIGALRDEGIAGAVVRLRARPYYGWSGTRTTTAHGCTRHWTRGR